ncbi:hypothetical protein ACFMPD_04990 [Sedimentitalea sp. HM32M-2]|uniref:hypothetical protein n=1 Tax=Sedimentitalea sp. HM32M-2 TaxID=3351566 RepID=UPI0036314CA4
MKKTLTFLMVAGLIVSGCGWQNSRINPTNWGKSRTQTVASAEVQNTLIPKQRDSLLRKDEAVDNSVLIAQVTRLQIDRTPTGAIILAEGLASRQGAYGAELRATHPDLVSKDGVLELDFRVTYPIDNTAVGSERTRKVVNAISMTTQDLANVRKVRVKGAQNALESRRR